MEKFIVKVCFPYGHNPDKKYRFFGFERYEPGEMVVVSNIDGSLRVGKIVEISPYVSESGARRPIVCKVNDRNLALYDRISELETMRDKVNFILRKMEQIQNEINVLMEEHK